MSAQQVAHAARVIEASWDRGVEVSPAMDAAQALHDRGLLQSPETAAETARLRAGVGEVVDRLRGILAPPEGGVR
ncbi:hypothetical protein ABZ442_05180 [Streptomyces triculaminicus]|uniref:hypothetical protein n=1 Tax=Streptomyces triculaminicus TaxID=2816232 RepID=UPI0033DEC8F4